jgi:hypothetical protein
MSDLASGHHESDAVKVKLLQGVLYTDDLTAWECLLRHEESIRAFFLQLALDVEIDRGEGYAYLRQREPGTDVVPNFPPRLFRRIPLSYDVTLLCVLLRERLLGFEKEQPDARKLVLGQDDLFALLEGFSESRGDEVRRKRDFAAIVNRVVELGLLRQTESGANPAYEVRRILRAKIPVETLEQIKEELKARADRLA